MSFQSRVRKLETQLINTSVLPDNVVALLREHCSEGQLGT